MDIDIDIYAHIYKHTKTTNSQQSSKEGKNVEEILYISLLILLGLGNCILGKVHLRLYFKHL